MKQWDIRRLSTILRSRFYPIEERWFGRRSAIRAVIFESDDWGSIRTSSPEALHKLQQRGYDFRRAVYSYDALAGEEDLERLFAVLTRFNDRRGRHPVLVANVCVGNPDFERIQASGYREYFWEPFTATLSRYPRHGQSFALWKRGMTAGVFSCQLHGREHIAVREWLAALQKGDRVALDTFEYGMCGLEFRVTGDRNQSFYRAMFGFDRPASEQAAMLEEAVNAFQKIFDYSPVSFIAPNYTWTDVTETILKRHGIRIIQSGRFQRLGDGRLVGRYPGASNRQGLYYSVRNCNFEPGVIFPEDAVANTLEEIDCAFRHHRVAVINTHRMNYIGFIDEMRRDAALLQLEKLLSELLTCYPDVCFFSPEEYYNFLQG